MNAKQAKAIMLTTLMDMLGYKAIKTERGGQELKYLSPFRKEAEPSFNVNLLKNSWYDFGEGEGGNTLDFVVTYLRSNGKPSSVKDALSWLDQTTGRYKSTSRNTTQTSNHSSFSQQAAPEVKITAPKAPTRLLEFIRAHNIEDPRIYSYLNKRGIPPIIVDLYLQEIHYRNIESGKPFFAFGMPNAGGGYEIRAASDKLKFKSSLIANDISFIGGTKGEGVVNVFEGMTDFLSLLVMLGVKNLKGDSIIMHSLSSFTRTCDYIKANGYSRINTFLDNNKSGESYSLKFAEVFGDRAINNSPHFQPHEDLNDTLRSGAIPNFTPKIDYPNP